MPRFRGGFYSHVFTFGITSSRLAFSFISKRFSTGLTNNFFGFSLFNGVLDQLANIFKFI